MEDKQKDKRKLCFITAPFGVDLVPLREALRRRHINWLDSSSVEPTMDIADAIHAAIEKADFICAVLADRNVGSVLFELGMGYGKKKPALVLVDPEVNRELWSGFDYFKRPDLLVARMKLKDKEALELQLDAFLEHASVRDRQKVQRTASKKEYRKSQHVFVSHAEGDQLQTEIANLLQSRGYIVSVSPEDKGVDMAVWLEDLQGIFPNPVAIQVKRTQLSREQLNQAEAQLREYLMRVHGHLGLLIYQGEGVSQDINPQTVWPLVLRFSFTQFRNLVERSKLTKEIVQTRNQLTEGGCSRI